MVVGWLSWGGYVGGLSLGGELLGRGDCFWIGDEGEGCWELGLIGFCWIGGFNGYGWCFLDWIYIFCGKWIWVEWLILEIRD